MRIWSILLIKSVLKYCVHLRRSLFLYYYLSLLFLIYLLSVTQTVFIVYNGINRREEPYINSFQQRNAIWCRR